MIYYQVKETSRDYMLVKGELLTEKQAGTLPTELVQKVNVRAVHRNVVCNMVTPIGKVEVVKDEEA